MSVLPTNERNSYHHMLSSKIDLMICIISVLRLCLPLWVTTRLHIRLIVASDKRYDLERMERKKNTNLHFHWWRSIYCLPYRSFHVNLIGPIDMYIIWFQTKCACG